MTARPSKTAIFQSGNIDSLWDVHDENNINSQAR